MILKVEALGFYSDYKYFLLILKNLKKNIKKVLTLYILGGIVFIVRWTAQR